MNYLNGRRVILHHPQPKMQVSPEFARIQDPALVASTNAWMANFFGYTCMIPDGVVYEINMMSLAGEPVLVMSSPTYHQLKQALKARQDAAFQCVFAKDPI